MKKLPWTDTWKKYKIYSKDRKKEIETVYSEPEIFEKAVSENPYDILIDFVGKTFKQTDAIVLENFPQFKDSYTRCKWIVWSLLKDNESDGDTCINANILAKVLKKDYAEVYSHIIDVVKTDDLFYYEPQGKMVAIRATYESEKKVAEVIKDRVAHPIKFNMDWEKYTAVDGLALTDEQIEILKFACTKSIMMLNGSAGTGKTSAMNALVTMLEDEGYGCTIVAPTGIAAKRISEVTGHSASTIHKFIASRVGISDFLIIDEMSMVGVQLLASLFSKLNDDTKIVFICDEAQLCSISCGNIVQDIIDSGIIPIVNLTRVFRYGKGGIATVATDVRNGKKLSEETSFNDYAFVPAKNKIMDTVMETYRGLLTQYAPEDIMILSPFNVHDAGTYAINSAIQSEYNSNSVLTSYNKTKNVTIDFKLGDRIINTENNYKMHGEYGDIAVMNGERGVVLDYYDGYLKVEYESGVAYLENEEIWKQLLGYSITIHKSQGSQAKAVIVIVDKSHGFFLTRNLLYVALSRAQEKLVLIGDIDTINSSLPKEENKIRSTWLRTLLN